MHEQHPSVANASKRVRCALMLTIIAALLASSGTAAAQTRMFLLLEGKNGPISSLSGTPDQNYQDHTRIQVVGGNLYVEDAQAQTLANRPIRVTKLLDPSSPRLLEALSGFEQITGCRIIYTSSGSGGASFSVYRSLPEASPEWGVLAGAPLLAMLRRRRSSR